MSYALSALSSHACRRAGFNHWFPVLKVPAVVIDVVETQADVLHATAFMRRIAAEHCAPVEVHQIDGLVSDLGPDGGPDRGCGDWAARARRLDGALDAHRPGESQPADPDRCRVEHRHELHLSVPADARQ